MRDTLKNFFQFLLAKKFQFSLAFLLPLFLVLFVLGPLYIALDHFENLIPEGERTPGVSAKAVQQTAEGVRMVMWASAAAALAVGIALVYSILTPLRKFTADSGVLAGISQQSAETADDFAILGRDFGMLMGSLSRHVSILEGMSGGVIAFDHDGRVITVNPSAERILGRKARDLLGKPLPDVCRTVVQSPDMERLVIDGLLYDRAYVSEEVRISRHAGSDIVAGLTTSLLKDEKGRTSGVVATFLDLTGIKLMHENLQQRLRLAGLGMLAAGVAHEVRNPLGAIKGMAQLIQEGLPDPDPRRKYGKIIEQESDRLNSVVEDLLSLVHGPTARVPCDINALLIQARELASHALPAEGVDVLDERGEIPEIEGEGGRLVQAFLNLFLNAFEAVPSGGRVRFKTSYSGESRSIAVEVGNTGTPIPPAVKERMFEPFFTTKDKGSGLGLAIAHQIVTAHGGSLSLESTRTETVFRVVLPAGEREKAKDEG